MTKTAHGNIVSASFSSERKDERLWLVRFHIEFEASQELRIPLTFSVLGKARTRLVSMEKGVNTIEDVLELEDPVKNNPFSFIGTSSTEAMARLDGETVTGEVTFA